jgi:hypothetical protein
MHGIGCAVRDKPQRSEQGDHPQGLGARLMAFDYAPAIALATTQIADKGRSVTLRRLNVTPPDSAVPWRGAVDPRAVPDATLTVSAAFLQPSSQQRLGISAVLEDFVPRSMAICMVAHADDLKDYHELLEGNGTTWRIATYEQLGPGPARIIHYLGVAR